MRSIFIKATLLLTFSVVLIGCSYYWGYLCGRQNVNFIAFDKLLINLSNYMLIRDALEVNEHEQIKSLVKANIESDFIRMVHLYEEHKFENAKYLRCLISRRIRSLREYSQIMIDEKTLEDTRFSIDKINNYLETECLGKPSHTNWVQEKPSKLRDN